MVFDKNFFLKHQAKLLWLLSAPAIRVWFRHMLRIEDQRPIIRLAPNHYTVLTGKTKERVYFETDFRTHNKFAKRLYYAFRPVWFLMHVWDLVADRFIPGLSFGFSTLTAFPDADTETTTVDGTVKFEDDGSPRSWASIIGPTGNGASDSGATGLYAYFQSYFSSGTFFTTLQRSIFLFDTSALTANAVISAAVLSLFGTAKADGFSASPNLDIYTSNPASNTALVGADYNTLGSVSQTGAPVSYSGFSTSAYNAFPFNATGISNINKTGVSKFGARNANYDAAASAPPNVQNVTSSLSGYFADQTGTSNDPKLVVTYSMALTRTMSDSMMNAASRVATVTRSASYFRTMAASIMNAAGRFASMKVLVNGLSTWFSNKFTGRSTSYGDKFDSQGTTYNDKY